MTVRAWPAYLLTFGLTVQTIIGGEIFLIAIALHLEVQARAQEEIDRVAGTHRLPDSSTAIVCRMSR